MAGFIPKNYNDGAVDPWVYLPAASGTYHIGEALYQSSGNLTKASGTTEPTFICMAEKTVSTSGDIIPAIAVNPDTEYEVELTAAVSGLKNGGTADLSTDGMSLAAATSGGIVRVITTTGAAIGDIAVVRLA
ncbi:MAG: hypothetical protein ACI3XQ_11280 [Eubacteriales bacterium]